ncbi:MAG: aspartate--tRNA ligase [Planctomycetes bacterium]|nr:aspartate--tRNA ligase [Planctomycetota bacterium]
MRTHTCGELRPEHAGARVALAGWVDRVRDHGNLVFVDLRDRYGRTQIVFHNDDEALLASARALKSETVLRVEGEVGLRSPQNANPKIPTGGIEVVARVALVLNPSRPLPFEITDDVDPATEVRLRYRYLDLRREKVRNRIALRHRIVAAMRKYLWSQDFLEIETPYLTRSTPEGARDYLVPSRISRGSFYALPQSPQILKQILMVSGMDRYFQIVRCFRDEDLRADRQPEFTQLDLEMSFVDQEGVLRLVEGLVRSLMKEVLEIEVEVPFRRLPYREAMERYGCDKPDLRYGLELIDLGEIASRSEFRVFREVLAKGGVVKGIRVPGGGKRSRKQVEELEAYAKEFGAGGLAWLKVEGGELKGSVAKFFAGPAGEDLKRAAGAGEGDLLLVVADQRKIAFAALDKLRQRLAGEEGLARSGRFEFAWVVDFPLFERSEEEMRWVSCHHPFTSARPEDLDRIHSDPGSVRARAYDLVLNGYELGGGSVRIHRRADQEEVFRGLGLSEETMREQFGFFLDCLDYGAPPHAGIALGVDRVAMLLAGVDNIREVIAFPKTARASCLLTGAPAGVEARLLSDLGIRILPETEARPAP